MRTIVCLGDSLTGPVPGQRYLDKYIKWADLLQVGLDAVFGGGRVTVLNQGKAGDPSSGVLAVLGDRLFRHKPDVVVVLLGANNYGHNAPREAASVLLKADLLAIVQRAQAAGIHVLLLQYPKPRAAVMEKVWIHGDYGNAVVAEVASTTGAALLALAPFFDEAAKTQPLVELASAVDGIHLNPGGEMVLARAVLEKLRTLDWPRPWPGRDLGPVGSA